MNIQKNNIAWNLSSLRRLKGITWEEVADKIGATRQAVGKWESGETVPDLMHASALAELYGVTLDSLLHYNEESEGIPIPPKGKHIFGVVTLGERGQIVLPKRARDVFGLKAGSMLVVLGDEAEGSRGIALVEGGILMEYASKVMDVLGGKEE